jgi:hypothetical protein
MSYTCKRCGYYTEYKGNLKNHLNRKRQCKPIKSNISFDTLKKEFINLKTAEDPIEPDLDPIEPDLLRFCSDLLRFAPILLRFAPICSDFAPIDPECKHNVNIVTKSDSKSDTKSDSELIRTKRTKCQYCQKVYSKKSNLKRHQLKCSNNINIMTEQCNVDHIVNKIEDRHKRINELRKQHAHEIEIAEMRKQHAREIELLLEKVGDTNNNQTYIKEQKITINNYGKENLEYISETYLIQLLQLPYGCVPKLIKTTHFHPEHPENHNIKITNKKLPYASVWKDKKWEVRDKKTVIKDLVDKNYNLMDDVFSDNKSIVKFKNFKDNYENDDKQMIKQLQKETEVIIINNSCYLNV